MPGLQSWGASAPHLPPRLLLRCNPKQLAQQVPGLLASPGLGFPIWEQSQPLPHSQPHLVSVGAEGDLSTKPSLRPHSDPQSRMIRLVISKRHWGREWNLEGCPCFCLLWTETPAGCTGLSLPVGWKRPLPRESSTSLFLCSSALEL